ncbi:MAG: hypothetical protein ACJ8JD_03740 [Chthoniobacterales bacterium]
MTKSLLVSCLLTAAATAVFVTELSAKPTRSHARQEAPRQFTFNDAAGKPATVDVVDHYQPKKLQLASGGVDTKLAQAATIAQERANAHSRRMCWAYVKDALLAAGAVSSRPTTGFAKQAGDELVQKYGFKKLSVTDPYKAPVGAVLVYTAKGAPGHVEIRTQDGFVSDFRSKTPSPRPLIGIYGKS